MKKFCLLLVLFTFISTMPAFALKVIVNNNGDRKVPSRCSGPVEEYTFDNFNQAPAVVNINQNVSNPDQDFSDYNPAYHKDQYEMYYKPLLSRDMREELIGTQWDFPAYNPGNYNTNKVMAPPVEQPVQNITADIQPKRFLREAADYYTQNTLGADPNYLQPAGFVVN